MVASPYGSWTSPITSDLVVAEAIRLDQVAPDGDAIYWTPSSSRRSRDASLRLPGRSGRRARGRDARRRQRLQRALARA